MSARFHAEATSIPGLWLLHRQPLVDERGCFERLFCADELRQWGHPGAVAQANHSLTRRKGTIRGIHFQHPPHAEVKVVSCLRGRVFDVIVDLRRGPGFLKWYGGELCAHDHQSLLIPPGCAHGFQALDNDCEMLYFHSCPFVPDAEDGVRADDPRLAIAWPLPIGERSIRDASHPLLAANFAGFAP